MRFFNDVAHTAAPISLPRLHDTTGSQSGCQTGLTTLLNEQLERTAVRSTGCQARLYNRFDNRLYT